MIRDHCISCFRIIHPARLAKACDYSIILGCLTGWPHLRSAWVETKQKSVKHVQHS